jgi:hypothetical protein
LKTKLGSGNTVDVYSGDKCKNALIQIVCKPNKKDVNFETSISPPVQMVHRLQTETPSGISLWELDHRYFSDNQQPTKYHVSVYL